jgi:hypothetical protein
VTFHSSRLRSRLRLRLSAETGVRRLVAIIKYGKLEGTPGLRGTPPLPRVISGNKLRRQSNRHLSPNIVVARSPPSASGAAD